MTPEKIGEMFGVLVLSIPAMVFLNKALKSEDPAFKLMRFSFFFGFLCLCLPHMVLGWGGPEHPWVGIAEGVVRILIAVLGIVLAVKAFRLHHPAVGGVQASSATVLNLLHGAVGASFIMFAGFTINQGAGGDAWTYTAPDGLYHVTFPSVSWKENKVSGADYPSFANRMPQMVVGILAVERNKTLEEFDKDVTAFRKNLPIKSQSGTGEIYDDGVHPSGAKYCYTQFMDPGTKGKAVFVATALTYLPEKKAYVMMIFEGQPRMLSQGGNQAEMHTFQTAGRAICLSVR